MPKYQIIFSKRYKAIFTVEQETVYLDAVVDCRMNNKNRM
jgi:hypothetical protein